MLRPFIVKGSVLGYFPYSSLHRSTFYLLIRYISYTLYIPIGILLISYTRNVHPLFC